MAILFAGGELEDLTTAGTVGHNTSTTYYRTAYARTAIAVTGTGGTASYARASFTASSALSATARGLFDLINTNVPFLWLGSGGVPRLRLRPSSGSPSTIILDKWDGTTATTLGTSTTTITTGTQYRFDLIVDYAARVRVYLNGALIIDYTGDARAGGSVNLDSLSLSSAYSSIQAYWSEVIVADDSTLPLSLKTLVPDAAGDTSAWTGAYTDIDEVTASDSDTVSSGTAGQVSNFNCTGMPSGGGGLSVRAVKVVASALRGAAGPQKLQLGVKSGSTEGWSADIALSAGYTAVSHTWTVNPATGAAFTAAEIDSLKLALKSVA